MKPPTDADLGAFLDGELDLASHLALEAQVAADEPLRARLDELRRVRQAVREGASYHAAPAALRARIASVAAGAAVAAGTSVAAGADVAAGVDGAAAPARDARSASRPTPFGAIAAWLAWRPLAAGLAVAAAIAILVNVAWTRAVHEERLAEDVVASHVRATLAQRLVDVASSDHHTVKPWLSSHLDFSPPVVELALPGSTFVGGRVDYLEGRPVAALVYRQGPHVVTSFAWPATESDRAPEFRAERGFETAHWVRSGMHRWVVSDLNPQEFRTLVAALREAEPAR